MATVYLPVEAITGYTSEERAKAINAEIWAMRRPDTLRSANDVTRYYFSMIEHPTTGQWAIVGDTTEQVRVHNDVDLTNIIALLPELTDTEETNLTAHINANLGGSVAFSTFIPSTSTQLTYAEADTAGWFPADNLN